jgi:hypothetical protein
MPPTCLCINVYSAPVAAQYSTCTAQPAMGTESALARTAACYLACTSYFAFRMVCCSCIASNGLLALCSTAPHYLATLLHQTGSQLRHFLLSVLVSTCCGVQVGRTKQVVVVSRTVSAHLAPWPLPPIDSAANVASRIEKEHVRVARGFASGCTAPKGGWERNTCSALPAYVTKAAPRSAEKSRMQDTACILILRLQKSHPPTLPSTLF